MGFLSNVLTLGASGRIERKVEEFEELRNELVLLNEKMEDKKTVVNNKMETLIEVKTEAVRSLKKIERISDNLRGKDRDVLIGKLGKEAIQIDFSRIEETISVAEIAMNSAKGLGSGVATALGAWALVGQVGAASTGTAISALSGAAATKATLAWFGGGALAAGGGGIATGTMVLGGIVAIPAVLLSGIFSHVGASKKIKEIEQRMQEILEAMDQIENNLLKLDLLEKRTDELIISLNRAKDVFDLEIEKVYKAIYKIPFFSKLVKSIRSKIFRKSYFTDEDLTNIAYIGGLASNLATLIDTKVFD